MYLVWVYFSQHPKLELKACKNLKNILLRSFLFHSGICSPNNKQPETTAIWKIYIILPEAYTHLDTMTLICSNIELSTFLFQSKTLFPVCCNSLNQPITVKHSSHNGMQATGHKSDHSCSLEDKASLGCVLGRRRTLPCAHLPHYAS